MIGVSTIREKIEADGFAVVGSVIDEFQTQLLIQVMEGLGGSEAVRRRGGVFAVRNLLDLSLEVRQLADSPNVREIVVSVLGDEAIPVRGILFDKTPEANWKVPWHQDLTIAVTDRVEAEGFGPWSSKAGVLHVQPPAAILQNMLSVRIHLDQCDAENGALKVLPGSHRLGRVPEITVPQLCAGSDASVCAVHAGDAVLMRPLLLHSSSASTRPSHRRVVHIDFASVKLPVGMRWATEGPV